LALALASAVQGEIVNCDSLQVYRHFDIGTAKLAASARRGIPHHLIDMIDPDEVFTAGDYARQAREAIGSISARGRISIVAGGTGFYLRALLDGLFAGPSRNQSLRDRLAEREARRRGSLHRLLTRFDPASAARIHPHDVPKVMRALEVRLIGRRPASEMFQAGRDSLVGYRTLKLGLMPERGALYERLDERCRRMFEGGLIDEARRILDLGFPASSKPFESVGYKQALQLIRGEVTAREALFDAQLRTRQYAKRQITWFRREAGIEWLPGFGEDADIQQSAIDRVTAFLRGADS
jgi:tRNA dimethylallyltransferase